MLHRFTVRLNSVFASGLTLASLSGLDRFLQKDYKKAFEWYEKAASQGYADAQYSLGNMYKYGRGVEKDSKKAKKLFKEACDGGHQDSCKLI